MGPAFQYAFTPFHYPGFSLFDLFHLNLYTMPAYLACAINVLGIVALYTMFVEKYDGIVEEVCLLVFLKNSITTKVAFSHHKQHAQQTALKTKKVFHGSIYLKSCQCMIWSPFWFAMLRASWTCL